MSINISYAGARKLVGSSALSNLVTAGAGTMACWAKPGSGEGSASSATAQWWLPTIFGDDSGGYIGVFIGTYGGNDRIWCFGYDGSNKAVGMTYTLDAWVHVALTWNGTTMRLYKNGVEGVNQAFGNVGSLGANLSLGHGYTSAGTSEHNGYFTGELAEFASWNVALGVDEIAALAKGWPAPRVRPSALTADIPMYRYQAAIEDRRNGRNLTPTNVSDTHSYPHAPVLPRSRRKTFSFAATPVASNLADKFFLVF